MATILGQVDKLALSQNAVKSKFLNGLKEDVCRSKKQGSDVKYYGNIDGHKQNQPHVSLYFGPLTTL